MTCMVPCVWQQNGTLNEWLCVPPSRVGRQLYRLSMQKHPVYQCPARRLANHNFDYTIKARENEPETLYCLAEGGM